jgi:hypothetical protein
MNIRKVVWRACLPLMILMAAPIAGAAESPPTGGAPSSIDLPNKVTAPVDHHVYTTQEMVELFRRPESVPELLRNLQIAWANNLLAQPAFFDDASLMKVLNAKAKAWDKQIIDKSGEYSRRSGIITLDARIFPNAIVRVVSIHHVAKAQSSPAIHVNIPAYVEDMGAVEMNVESSPGFTWAAVKAAFGPHAEDQGDQAIYEGFPPPAVKPEGKAWMRYLHPGEDPAKFGIALRPEAMFIIKPDAVPDLSDLKVPRRPKDNDEVKFFRIYDSLTLYSTDDRRAGQRLSH